MKLYLELFILGLPIAGLFALLATGVVFGPVRVRTATSSHPPPPADDRDGWEEVIEVTVHAPADSVTGQAR